MNEQESRALVPKPPSAVEKQEPGAKRILSNMVADTLAIAKAPEAATADAKLDLSGEQPLGKCPNCGGRVFEAAAGYLCERSQVESQACKFKIGKIVMQQPIAPDQIRQLLATGKTDLLNKFVSTAGRIFSAHLIIGAGKIVFEFPVYAELSKNLSASDNSKPQFPNAEP